jgi:hypothetical protein
MGTEYNTNGREDELILALRGETRKKETTTKI